MSGYPRDKQCEAERCWCKKPQSDLTFTVHAEEIDRMIEDNHKIIEKIEEFNERLRAQGVDVSRGTSKALPKRNKPKR